MIEWVLVLYTVTFPHALESADKFKDKQACIEVAERLQAANQIEIIGYRCKPIRSTVRLS